MLPIFRLIPVGGVFLAIAILLLALNPPQATSRSARAALQPARGALIDRTEHPEWRQFLIQAALRRAGEVERLRNLHDTVAGGEPPVAMMPTPAPVEPGPDIIAAPSAEAKPAIAETRHTETAPQVAEAATAHAAPEIAESTEPKTVEAEPKVANLTPIIGAEPEAVASKPAEPIASEPEPVAAKPEITDAAPAEPEAEAAEPKIADLAPIIGAEPEAAAPKPAEPVASEPEPVAAKPEITDAAPAEPGPEAAEPKIADLAPIIGAGPATPAAPSREDATATTLPLETNGSRIRGDVAPPATPSPAETKIAALPTPPTENAGDDITGSIEPAGQTTTIPVGIGAASSTELQVTLPRERPPALKTLDLRRARESKAEKPRHRVRHVRRRHISRAKRRKPEVVPPEFAFFALLIKTFDPDAEFDPNTRFEPIKPTIPYQPNNSWQRK